MKIDVNRYRSNIEWLKGILDRERARATFDRKQHLSLLSSLTGIPMIALLYFYGELYGTDKDLDDCIESIVAFYGYTEIEL